MSLTERFSGCRQSKRPEAHPIGHARTHAQTPTQLRSITRPNVLCVHARGPGSSLMPYRCPRRPFWAAVVVGIARSRWYRTDVPPPAAFQEQSSSRQLRACIPCVKHNEHAACGLSSPNKSAGRGHSALESRVSVWTRGYRPNAQVLMDHFAHTAGSYHYASWASVKLQGRVSFAL